MSQIPNEDSDNVCSTYPLINKDATRDESSSSTLKASNDQISSSITKYDKKQSTNSASTAT